MPEWNWQDVQRLTYGWRSPSQLESYSCKILSLQTAGCRRKHKFPLQNAGLFKGESDREMNCTALPFEFIPYVPGISESLFGYYPKAHFAEAAKTRSKQFCGVKINFATTRSPLVWKIRKYKSNLQLQSLGWVLLQVPLLVAAKMECNVVTAKLIFFLSFFFLSSFILSLQNQSLCLQPQK